MLKNSLLATYQRMRPDEISEACRLATNLYAGAAWRCTLFEQARTADERQRPAVLEAAADDNEGPTYTDIDRQDSIDGIIPGHGGQSFAPDTLGIAHEPSTAVLVSNTP